MLLLYFVLPQMMMAIDPKSVRSQLLDGEADDGLDKARHGPELVHLLRRQAPPQGARELPRLLRVLRPRDRHHVPLAHQPVEHHLTATIHDSSETLSKPHPMSSVTV